jgi:phage repressor protein C with HTH and peptisase S24 domain
VSETFRLDTLLELLGESGQEMVYELEGNCMAPALRGGDRIVIRHGTHGVSRFGEIVVVRRAGRVLVQRVVRRTRAARGERLTVKGDNSLVVHESVTPDEVVGRVVAVRRPRGEVRFDGLFGRWIGRMRAARSLFGVARRRGAVASGRPLEKG